MRKTRLLSIAAVFCFALCIASTEEVSEVDVSISQTERTNYEPVNTVVNKEFHFNGSELEADECRCKNGKCLRVCDVDKTVPCEDQRKVCVCNPEFGKISENKCEHCFCGKGFNCTFEQNERICICPKGFYKYNYFSKCRPECNKERPCQNGGTCQNNKMCKCPFKTRGDLCEEIIECGSKCKNRLEVDCLLNKREGVVYCDCKNSSLYYDQEADICKPCPCENGYCDYEYSNNERRLICVCKYGYRNFNGYCKKCDCGFSVKGQCDFDSKGEQICKCYDGYYEREGLCQTCDCHPWRSDTNCELIDNVKRCFCKEGLQNFLGHCEDINECETNNTCHPATTCYNTFGSFECKCPEGYRGNNGVEVEPGEICEDIDECTEMITACWYWDNVKCVNLPGSYKCECLQGYKPSRYYVEPQKTTCFETTKNVGPAVIVVFTTLVLMSLSCCVHKRVKKRTAHSN